MAKVVFSRRAVVAAGLAAPALALAQAPGAATFPAGFVWGVAASAAQTESRQGRGRSNWDVYAEAPGAILDGSTNALCTQFDTRYAGDLDQLAGAGVKAFRFSAAWPRVQPEGPGRPSDAGLDLYSRMVDAMLERGIAPWLTVFHWDTPVWAGDLRQRDMAGRLADYAEILSRRLGDRVVDWMTVNEPCITALFAYGGRSLAPGLGDIRAMGAAFHHQNLAQGLIRQAMAPHLMAGARIGGAFNLVPVVAASDAAADIVAAGAADALYNRTQIDPLFGRPYPASAAPFVEPFLQAGDGAILAAGRPDFVGVNYYSRSYVQADPGSLGYRGAPAPASVPRTDYFDFEPGGLTEVLLRVKRDYGDPLVFVTETGFAERDSPAAQGMVDDRPRIEHLRAYLEACGQAIADGVRLGGVFYWAASDNWEWRQGFSKRFGLIAVDPATQIRTPKASLAWYGACARANAIV